MEKFREPFPQTASTGRAWGRALLAMLVLATVTGALAGEAFAILATGKVGEYDAPSIRVTSPLSGTLILQHPGTVVTASGPDLVGGGIVTATLIVELDSGSYNRSFLTATLTSPLQVYEMPDTESTYSFRTVQLGRMQRFIDVCNDDEWDLSHARTVDIPLTLAVKRKQAPDSLLSQGVTFSLRVMCQAKSSVLESWSLQCPDGYVIQGKGSWNDIAEVPVGQGSGVAVPVCVP